MSVKIFIFNIDPQEDLELMWQKLESFGCHLLYSCEEGSLKQVFGSLPQNINKKTLIEHYPEILSIEQTILPEVNWEAQWSVYENYHEGYLHINLEPYVKISSKDLSLFHLKLIPGPGFGDLSHPTTRLVLSLMSPFVRDHEVIDMGCGSGILSLAAIAMGAKKVIGIDIDEKALIHSQTNRDLNGISEKISFLFPDELHYASRRTVVLMNMIYSEQLIALSSLSFHLQNVSYIITSGILKEQRIDYLKRCKKWKLIHELEEDNWVGFVFLLNSS